MKQADAVRADGIIARRRIEDLILASLTKTGDRKLLAGELITELARRPAAANRRSNAAGPGPAASHVPNPSQRNSLAAEVCPIHWASPRKNRSSKIICASSTIASPRCSSTSLANEAMSSSVIASMNRSVPS